MDTLDLKQAAAFLKMHPEEVRRRARLGLLPGAKPGNAWLEWHWLDRAPKVKLYPEAKRRVRWTTPEQARALLRELPSHQRDIVTFALATGLRQANLARLEWQHVDLACGTCWIPGDRAKGGDDLHVSLNEAALAVLQRQRSARRERVFTYHGKPINQVNTKAWRAALRRAGIDNFRWHDLRHSGPAGWSSMARRCTTCRRWAAGS